MSYDTINNVFTGIAAVEHSCWCGISYAIPKSLDDYYRRQNERAPQSYSIYCPLGHAGVPAGRSEAERLRDELTRAKQREEQARADSDYQRGRVALRDRQIAARKGQLTKLRKRVEKGVCPCCNRYFANLHRHMNTQHPKWQPVLEDTK